MNNELSSLTTLDLSRNYTSFDDVEEVHVELIEAILNQSRINEEEVEEDSSPRKSSISRKSRLSSNKRVSRKSKK